MESVELMANQQINSDFWRGKKVLLTGHTGFKGGWLGLWLSELGAHVAGVGLQPDTEPNLFTQLELQNRIQSHHIADIRDLKALSEIVQTCQPQVVLHLAAQPLVRRSYIDPLGTWATNVQGSLHLLEALKTLETPCAVVMVTTDKVYANQEWDYGYRESDRLGGFDLQRQAAAELAIVSWRSSFCGYHLHQSCHLAIATARAGNVIGGGDWAPDQSCPMRCVPFPRPPHCTAQSSSDATLAACWNLLWICFWHNIWQANQLLRTGIPTPLILAPTWKPTGQ